jgi:hypothetical protein
MARKVNAKGRNKSQSFVMLRHDIMDSSAWLSLSPVARCVWTEVVRRYNGANNGNIPLSCREVSERLRISKDTAGRAFDDLMERGFITIAVDSAFRVKLKKSRRWRLTHLYADYNCDEKTPTNEWKKWKNKTRSDNEDNTVR